MPVCPVCGYPGLQEPPRSPSGGGSYEICPSCGFQFGVDDDDKGLSFTTARERWVQGGSVWASRGIAAPKGWNPQAQLAGLLPPSVKKGAGKRTVVTTKRLKAPKRKSK